MRKQEAIRAMLAVGRHRLDPGRSCEVAELVLASPRKVGPLIACLWDEDPAVANRAADALERATYHHRKLAQAWKRELIGLMAETEQNKLRWNLALLVPRLRLNVAKHTVWPRCFEPISTIEVLSLRPPQCMVSQA
jgi:hypothetical protein